MKSNYYKKKSNTKSNNSCSNKLFLLIYTLHIKHAHFLECPTLSKRALKSIESDSNSTSDSNCRWSGISEFCYITSKITN